jgi:teichuronic acid biosynthesis glycosyltransferase TuaG
VIALQFDFVVQNAPARAALLFERCGDVLKFAWVGLKAAHECNNFACAFFFHDGEDLRFAVVAGFGGRLRFCYFWRVIIGKQCCEVGEGGEFWHKSISVTAIVSVIMNDLVTVIIPSFNSERSIIETLESVRAQTHMAWECIVIDDCSSDNSPARIEAIAAVDNRIRLVRLTTPSGGPAHPRNVGLDMAQGAYVAFLDSDDVWHPQKLEIQLAALHLHKARFCSTAMTRFRDAREIAPLQEQMFPMATIRETMLVQRISHDILLRKNIIPNSSVMAERSVFEHIRFNETPDYCLMEDFHGWLLVHQTEVPVSIKISPKLLFYRLSPTSISRVKTEMVRRHWRLYKNYHIHGKPIPFLQRIAYMGTYAFSSVTNLMGLQIVNTLDNVSENVSENSATKND